MLNSERIKDAIKKKGFTLEYAAIEIGMSYQGFYKALKKGILRHERKVLLSEIIGLTIEEMDLEPPKKERTDSIHILQQMLEDTRKIINLQEQEIERLNNELIRSQKED